MRHVVILLTLLVAISNCCKTTKSASSGKAKEIQSSVPEKNETNPAVNFSDKSTWITGYFKPEKLTREPYSSWYVTGYEDYQIDSDWVNALLDISKENVSIKIVMGTWCPDSRREVPRMIRILDIWRLPMSQVTFIGVDNKKNTTVSGYDSLKIERVPTFIIYKNNIEAGRIIETPETSLEQDMVNILTRKSNNNKH